MFHFGISAAKAKLSKGFSPRITSAVSSFDVLPRSTSMLTPQNQSKYADFSPFFKTSCQNGCCQEA